MPTLAQFANCRIAMFPADHPPPHFHLRMNDGRDALVDIGTLSVLKGRVTVREVASALHWAALNRVVLTKKWKELSP